MGIEIVTAATTAALTVAEVKTHLRISQTDDEEDDYIETLIEAATDCFEIHTNRQLITATWAYTMSEFPASDSGYISLPYPPLQSISSITYYDTAGDSQTFSSDYYQVDTTVEPGRVYLEPTYTWPNTEVDRRNAVTVTFKAGYGDARSNVPRQLRHGLLLLIGHWYENREGSVVGVTVNELPMAVQMIISNYAVLEI